MASLTIRNMRVTQYYSDISKEQPQYLKIIWQFLLFSHPDQRCLIRYFRYFASVVGVHSLLTFQLISLKPLAKLEQNLVEMFHGWSSALYLILAAFWYSIWLIRQFILLSDWLKFKKYLWSHILCDRIVTW